MSDIIYKIDKKRTQEAITKELLKASAKMKIHNIYYEKNNIKLSPISKNNYSVNSFYDISSKVSYKDVYNNIVENSEYIEEYLKVFKYLLADYFVEYFIEYINKGKLDNNNQVRDEKLDIIDENINNELVEFLEEEVISVDINGNIIINENWQHRFINWLKSIEKNNPIVAAIVKALVNNLLFGIILIYIGIIMPLHLSVKSEPTQNANVIAKIPVSETVIINNWNYYYEIEFYDTNGDKLKGYVSKVQYNKKKKLINEDDTDE